MCGINYSKIQLKLKSYNYKVDINRIKKLIDKEDLLQALKIIKKFRNNFIFIEIINENKKIIDDLKKILISIKELKKKNDFKQFDKLNDFHWIIESEIFFKTKRITEFLKKNKIKISANSIIFARYFLYNIESMNYLESRGRDSLGISINFIFENKLNFKTNLDNSNNFSLFYKDLVKNSFLNITAKYSKRIGMSGENSNKILDIFEEKKILKKLSFENLKSFEIYSHTRWASVGDVTNSNAHPLLEMNKNNLNICLMNGDINNYKDIKKELIKKNKFLINDLNCKNDLQVVPSLFYFNKNKFNNFAYGSYVLFNFNSHKLDQFFIYKKGSQGLYYSLDEDDNIHFASDVYGLINKVDKLK